MASVISDECHIALHNLYGSDYVNLNKEEQLVLATAFTEGSTSNYRMQQLLGKNSLEVGKILYAMVGRAMLVPVNRGRWTSYSLNYEYLEEEKSRSKSQGVKSQGVESQGVKSRNEKRQETIQKLISLISKNFYSTAFAPRCNFYNFTELLKLVEELIIKLGSKVERLQNGAKLKSTEFETWEYSNVKSY